jgi:hypothetical protein
VGRRLLRAITRTGAVLCAPAAVVGLALMAIADQHGIPIESLSGEIGLALFIFGLLAPFGFWSGHLAVEQWVDEAGDFYAGQYTRPVTVAASVSFGLLALGVFTLAFFPILAFTPDQGAGVWAELVLLIVGSICLGLVVSAIAGGVALFGWSGAVVGALTGTGFTLLVWGLTSSGARPLVPTGLALLVLGTGGFWGLRGLARMAGREI